MRLSNKRTLRSSGGLLMYGAALAAALLLVSVVPGGVAAAAMRGTGVNGTAATTPPAKQTASASASAMTVAKPLTGQAAPDQDGGFSCVKEIQKSKTATAYQVLKFDHTARSYAIHWRVFPYSLKHARTVNGQKWTFQIQLCATGGGNTWNVWDQYFDGIAMTLKYTSSQMIGWTWPSKVDNGTASSSLNFEVNLGVVSIGGSDAVSNYGTHSGNPGVNTNIRWPSGWKSYDNNRLNTYYSSAHTFWYQGTSAFEGNVGQALYEFVTNGSVNFSYGADWAIAAQCHRLVGSCVNFS